MLVAGLMLLAITGTTPTADIMKQEQDLEQRFQSQVHITTMPFKPEPAPITINTTPAISYTDKNGVHEARLDELPPPIQGIFTQWAGYTTDQPSGATLFSDMFYKFFFVHELGHWTTGQVLELRQDADKQTAIKNMLGNNWQTELEVNRIAVAWWRENDPAFLAKLVGDFRKIQAALPNPVPPGADMQKYFADNYEKLGEDPQAYGWFLLQSVIMAYDEPARPFQNVIDDLPTYNFE
jgi:hypothetical protein